MDGEGKARASGGRGAGIRTPTPAHVARAEEAVRGVELASPAARIESAGVRRVVLTPDNTTVRFIARWFGAPVEGRFEAVAGAVEIPGGDVSRASVSAEIATDSVRTGIGLRDRHLRRAVFLDAELHPVISFRGGSVMRWPTHLSLPGSLTIRGVTRTEELRVTLSDLARRSRDEPIRLVAHATLRRSDYSVGAPVGLRRFSPLLAAIGDTVEVRIGVRLD